MENSPSKTDAARAALAMVDQFCASVTPSEVEMFDIEVAIAASRLRENRHGRIRQETPVLSVVLRAGVGNGPSDKVDFRPAHAIGPDLLRRIPDTRSALRNIGARRAEDSSCIAWG
jgi:hypothetical protein